MTDQNNAAQPGLTDEEIQDIADGFDIYGAKPEFARAIESALLSKLRAEGVQAGDERAAVDSCGYVAVKRSAVDWLKDKFPLLTIKAGLCERIGGRLYTITRLMIDHDAALASAPVADERAANDYTPTHDQPHHTGVGEWCAPGPAAGQRRAWLLRFADADRGDCVYYDEQEARRAFAQAEGRGWNCYLFEYARRAALASAPVAGEAQKPVAWMLIGRLKNSEPKFTLADPAGIYESVYAPLYAAPQASEAVRNALWTLTEHNALHFGEQHNTVIQGRAALRALSAQPGAQKP